MSKKMSRLNDAINFYAVVVAVVSIIMMSPSSSMMCEEHLHTSSYRYVADSCRIFLGGSCTGG